MAINKELYERYKAMKAAKLAAMEEKENPDSSKSVVENSTTLSGSSSESSGFRALSSGGVQETSHSENSGWTNTYYQQKTEEYHGNVGNAPTVNNVSESDVGGELPYSAINYGTILPKKEEPVENNIEQKIIESPIKKFALIGYPLGHSLSGYIHLAGFESLGIDATYEILETPPQELVDRIKYLKTNGYSGFNVTIPLKLPVSMFLDEVDEGANTVDAVNTVVINPKTKELKGYNTDISGFSAAIPKDVNLSGKVAGVLGTGGAARAAIVALARSQMKEIKLFTRNVLNCKELLEYLRKNFKNTEFNAYQIDRIRDLSDINILINATPIGMQGYAAGMTPVEERELQTLPEGAIVYDVIYNPKKTLLIQLAQKNNYRTVTGLDMLIWQAVEAQKIWTGRVPDFKDMKIAALENL